MKLPPDNLQAVNLLPFDKDRLALRIALPILVVLSSLGWAALIWLALVIVE